MKKAAIMALSVVFIFSAAVLALSDEEAYLAAMDHYNKKDFDNAKPLLEAFCNNYKDSKYRPSAMLKLAELTTDFYKAEAMYNEVIKDKPDTEFEAEAVYSLARLYYGRNEYVKCEEQAGIILGRFGNTVWIEPAYHYLMLALNAQKKYTDTERIFADYNSNKNFFLFKNRIKLAYADALYNQQKFLDSIAWYKQVIEEGEREKYIYMPDVYAKISFCYGYIGNSSEKEKYVYDLKEKFPDSPEAKAGGAIKPADDVLGTPPGSTPVPTAGQAATPAPAATRLTKSGVFYTVQIGAYSNKKFAEYDGGKIAKQKYEVFYKAEGKFTKVMVGRLTTKEEADALAKELAKKKLIKTYLVKQAWE